MLISGCNRKNPVLKLFNSIQKRKRRIQIYAIQYFNTYWSASEHIKISYNGTIVALPKLMIIYNGI